MVLLLLPHLHRPLRVQLEANIDGARRSHRQRRKAPVLGVRGPPRLGVPLGDPPYRET
jgi:hypothetical protein